MEKVMNKCVICNKEIKTDSQFIKDRWYHNKCIESLQENYERIYNENCILRERIEYLERSNDRREDEILSLRQELENISLDEANIRADILLEQGSE